LPRGCISSCQPGGSVIQTAEQDRSAQPRRSMHTEGRTLKKLVIFAVGSYSLLMVVSLVFAQVSAGKLTADRCSTCHSAAVICEKLGARTPEVWAQTVERMRGNGASLDEAEAQTVSEYLSTAKPGAKPLCQPKAGN